MTPLVKMLLRRGIPYKPVAGWLRWCYAHVAHKEFPLPNGKQSKSRVATISGLTRVDVDKLLKQAAPAALSGYQQYQRAAMVLAAWVKQAEDAGHSAIGDRIAYDGSENSFSQLVEQHSKGTTPRSILDDLQDRGCVLREATGEIRLLKREYASDSGHDPASEFDILGHAAGSLIATIAFNTQADVDETRAQGLAFNSAIPAELVPAVSAHIKQRAREVLFEIDDFLASHATPESTDPIVEAGVGFHFYIEQSQENDNEN